MSLLPTELDILGMQIKVVNEAILDKEEVYGDWDGPNLTIRVDATGTPDQQLVTLLHEVMHVIDEFTHMRLSHQNVYLISQLIFVFLKENPKLLPLFLKESV